MKKLLFIMNPTAGKTTIRSKMYEITDLFTKSDYIVSIYPTQSQGDAMRVLTANAKSYDLIVCAGGDGTLDECVTGLIKAGCHTPFGYIPCGTTNDFAKSLGIPKDPLLAAKKITEGDPFPIDIGRFMDRYFVYIATFGAFTDVSYMTPQKTKNAFGHAAYVLEGIKALPTVQSYQVDVFSDELAITGESFIFAMVTNSLSVGGFKSLSNKNVEFDDGLFEVLLVKKPQNAIELQSIINALLLNEIDENYMIQLKTSKITFHSKTQIPWCLDGENGGEHKEVTIYNEQKALSIMRGNQSSHNKQRLL